MRHPLAWREAAERSGAVRAAKLKIERIARPCGLSIGKARRNPQGIAQILYHFARKRQNIFCIDLIDKRRQNLIFGIFQFDFFARFV